MKTKKSIQKKSNKVLVGKASSKSKERPKNSIKFEGLSIPSWISQAQAKAKSNEGLTGQLIVLGAEDQTLFEQILREEAIGWQFDTLSDPKKELLHFTGSGGPVWIIREKKISSQSHNHYGLLTEVAYSKARDMAGALVPSFKASGIKNLELKLHSLSTEFKKGVFVGLELGSYHFLSAAKGALQSELPQLIISSEAQKLNSAEILKAKDLASSINIARHVVNLPPNFVNPSSLSKSIKKHKFKNAKIEVWDQKKLAKEGMGLHLGVGQGSESPPCLVKISYRPKVKAKLKPIAFVGKGITFDTGGLDLKPSSAMRLMKKDMGGAASVLALAHWVCQSGYQRSCDFYLALAENSMDSRSMRPSDVLKARNGMLIEIHNTDAEGRLVLADAIDVAVTSKEEPEFIIDVATLTGAIKVALGADLAGLFANHDELADQLLKSGVQMGDQCWRMPLVPRYNSTMSSQFADMVNAVDGFGGAITAAMFLEKFCRNKPWAHLDIYAWTDKANGALTSAGANGQAVQQLVQLLKKYETQGLSY
jgi:leucyl aminopeptidase